MPLHNFLGSSVNQIETSQIKCEFLMCLREPKLIRFIAYQQCSTVRQFFAVHHVIEVNLELWLLQGQANGQQKYKTHTGIHCLNFQLITIRLWIDYLCCCSWGIRLFKLLNEIEWKFHGRGKSLILGNVVICHAIPTHAVLPQNRCHVTISLFIHPLSLKICPFVESPGKFGSVIMRITSKISNGHLFESEQFRLTLKNVFFWGEKLFLY